MRQRWKAWSAREDAILLGGLILGMKQTNIALFVGRTQGSVESRINVLGLMAKDAPKTGGWPDLPANAFQSYKIPRDPGTVVKPESRTLAGVVGVL